MIDLHTWAVQNPTVSLIITILSYYLCLNLYKRFNHTALLQPVMISIVLIISLISFLEIPYAQYFDHNKIIHFLLGPATVALAIPLYKNKQRIRQLAIPLFSAVIIGGSMAIFFAVSIAWCLNATNDVLLSLAPKSVTTPIALSIAESINAIPSLTAAFVLITGVVGAVVAEPLFRLINEQDDGIKGMAIGISAHGVGTAKALEISPQCGAFSALSMGLTGAYTALVLPYAMEFLRAMALVP
ncbi:LrgB family protein [Litoribrevibacter albus]|uniref:Membrane protein n=1 Tax=Litoribrevibacter albus TaxID=1473156 RepID=A0AA37W5A2_9GAMM|nr:LrgB family protein [Litoribrevibacter albus]GLQ30972.1 membrane protein [Litoribrevibacter albus]